MTKLRIYDVAVSDKNEKNFQSGDIMHLSHVHNNFNKQLFRNAHSKFHVFTKVTYRGW